MVMPAARAPQRWIVTGGRGAGKTTFCRHAVERARAAGLDVAGLLSPARMEAGEKTGILVEDVRTGSRRLLASVEPLGVRSLPMGRWHFSPEAIRWADEVLVRATPCDLLVVDEIGPLELELRRGWTAWENAWLSGSYRAALAVVRSELEARFRRDWEVTGVIAIRSPEQAATEAATFVERLYHRR